MFENGGNVWKHTVKTDFISRVKRLLESTEMSYLTPLKSQVLGSNEGLEGAPYKDIGICLCFIKANIYKDYHVYVSCDLSSFFRKALHEASIFSKTCPGSESLNPKLCERWSFRSDDFQVQRWFNG